jgi:hypothetical protein
MTAAPLADGRWPPKAEGELNLARQRAILEEGGAQ